MVVSDADIKCTNLTNVMLNIWQIYLRPTIEFCVNLNVVKRCILIRSMKNLKSRNQKCGDYI